VPDPRLPLHVQWLLPLRRRLHARFQTRRPAHPVSVQLVGSVLTWAVSGQHGDGRAAGVVVKRVGYVLEEAAGLQAAGGVR
jgi:hypothetical protein